MYIIAILYFISLQHKMILNLNIIELAKTLSIWNLLKPFNIVCIIEKIAAEILQHLKPLS